MFAMHNFGLFDYRDRFHKAGLYFWKGGRVVESDRLLNGL